MKFLMISGDGDEPYQNIHDQVNLVRWAVVWTSEPLVSEVKSSRLVLEGPTQEIVLKVAPREGPQS
jgi:hypothetical protein